MSEKRKSNKKRKDEYTGPGGVEKEVEKPTKDEFNIAKWIKKNVPTKKTKFLNHNVEYFTSSKALDALMASKFGQGENCLFPTREIAIEFLDSMLVHKFFHRAKKVPVTEAELKRGKKAEKKTDDDEKKEISAASTKKKEEKVTDAESSHVEGKKDKVVEKDKEKKKRKIRLDMHPDQVFVDGGEAYVWIYDPIPMHYWLFGALLVFGAIVICLFPLWPPSLRKGVYYLSIAAAGFLVFILGLVVLRFIVFCIIWLLTRSKHHFWLFPNLTEDVGFFASFWPIYKHDYMADGAASKEKKRKRKKDKDSDAEEDVNVPVGSDRIENVKENDTETEAEPLIKVSANEPAETNEEKKGSPSESESESSQRSSTGKDFEIVDPEDVDTS
ncbi:translocation protein SEC62 isoform X2 [Bradysia coprophila]|uniref:translocation protein SEC62 isoform X2 n=1 Tax=Bradysia coprophila TaxID=38358 RepID=UPI00187DC3F5|nr:translocation protein SEC62 isoform X2 [Bradysia coprophila]